MSENRKHLIFKHICAMSFRKLPVRGLFRHYMAHFGGVFPSECGLGWEFPSLGSADPWGGDGDPWDGSVARPHEGVENSLEDGRRSLSALTVCHIAHRASRTSCDCGGRRRPPRGGKWDPYGVLFIEWGTFRGFACGSPAVIESSPPMGARASRNSPRPAHRGRGSHSGAAPRVGETR